MNSMFSSFDALCAEFLGQTVKASFPSVRPTRSSTGGRSSDELQGRRAGGIEDGAGETKKSIHQQQKMGPRFAPELDGIFCFETLVPH
ncbi:hypothetical protein SAY87_011203 [Trapa incisa]|uniref:Uncharacterized protein n=2 Tax=Trapa TaxID=22665 RepID=A0AAN7MCP5_TRANT|nr:hypothetical protein SAY87_011203 [Trapa incisa]KAK4794245.1 hypothetical protein SAY86_012239 [Trapa natans]